MTVRKNFTLPDDLAKKLEEMAKRDGKKQSQIIQEMIKKRIKEEEKEKKLESLHSLKGILTGKIPQDITIQTIMSEKNV
jgi:metal-responsive CopG/Arc/MetJ family transcriptional regulator